MQKIKKRHIITKTLTQLFLLTIEISIIASGLTWCSGCLWGFDSGLDILERIAMFYSIYQIITFIILSNINDIQADEYLALKSTAVLAAKACENNDIFQKQIIDKMINAQLDSGVFNDLVVRQKYNILKQLIETDRLKDIEYISIWAEHCCEEAKLQWKYSFILRIFK